MISRRSFGLVGAAAFAASCQKKRSAVYDVYIANEAGKAIAVVDLTAFALSRHIRLDDSPTMVIAPRGGSKVYALAPKTGTVYEIETDTLTVARKARVGPAISMRLAGESLWVLGKRSLIEIRRDTFRQGQIYSLPADAHDFDLSNRTNLAVVSYGAVGTLSVIHLSAKQARPPVKVSDSIGMARFRLDGEGLLVADTANRRLCVLDQDAQTIVNLPLAVRPDHLCFNQDGGQLFVTGEGRDAVVVIFPYYVPQVAETILAGHAPAAMAVSSTHLFLTNPQAGHITILDIARRKIVGVTAVGADPGFVAITPDGNYALVLNRQSGDMAVILTSEIVDNGRKTAGLFTMIPVGSRPVSAAIREA